jgi:hypothetical protein
MGDDVFNIAKGRVNEYVDRVANNDPAASTIVIVLLSVAEVDATLEDYDDLAALLAGANTEATFTNYARKALTDATVVAPAPDDTNNWQEADLPDQTWTAAGGTLDNTLVRLVVCYDAAAGADATIIPLTFHDFAVTTNGGDLTAQFAATGFFRAT